MLLCGRIWLCGDDVDTDLIIPARYLVSTDPAELALHCLEDVIPGFASRVRPGDLIVAGKNFGCGSSREHAPLALAGAGIAAVLAPSFARIFYRNAINIGLPVLEVVPGPVADGDELEVDLTSGRVTSRTRGWTAEAQPQPPFMREMYAAGGLIPYVRRKVAGVV